MAGWYNGKGAEHVRLLRCGWPGFDSDLGPSISHFRYLSIKAKKPSPPKKNVVSSIKSFFYFVMRALDLNSDHRIQSPEH